jgi:hypothetical protein
MGLFIEKEIDFTLEHSEFLKNSLVAKDIYNHLYEKFSNNQKDIFFITPTLKAYLENIIKHDLPLQAAIQIEHKWLITEDNSEDVKNIFLKTYFNQEDSDIIKYEKDIIEAKDIIKSIFIEINCWVLNQEYNPIDFIKKEFVDLYSIKNNIKKIGNKK